MRKALIVFLVFFVSIMSLVQSSSAGMFDGLKNMAEGLNPVSGIKQQAELYKMTGMKGMYAPAAKKQKLMTLKQESASFVGIKRFDLALPKAEEALALAEEIFGAESPEAAKCREKAAWANHKTDNFARAEILFRRTIDLSLSNPFANFPILSFKGLASLYEESGRLSEATNLYVEALKIFDKRPMDSFSKEMLLNDYGAFLYKQGDFENAKKYLEIAVIDSEKTENNNDSQHSPIFDIQKNLRKMVSQQRKQLADMSYMSSSTNAFSNGKISAFGGMSISGLDVYENLGKVYVKRKEFDKLENLYDRSLSEQCQNDLNNMDDISKVQVGGVFTSGTSLSCIVTKTYFSSLFATAGRTKKTFEILEWSLQEFHKKAEEQFNYFSWDDRSRNYLENTKELYSSLFYALDSNSSMEEYLPSAFTLWGINKGKLLDNQLRFNRAMSSTKDKKTRKNIAEYERLSFQTSQMVLNKSLDDEKDYLKLGQLNANKIGLQILIQRALLGEIKSLDKDVDFTCIIKQIPSDTVYLDFAKVKRFDKDKLEFKGYDYFSFLVKSSGDIRFFKLGDAELIEKLIQRYQSEIETSVSLGRPPEGDVLKKITKRLHECLIEPIEPSLAGFKRLIISPDGALHQMPFEVLMDSEGRFLIEKYTTSYVASSRDLLRRASDQEQSSDPVLIGDPNFDLGGEQRVAILNQLKVDPIQARGTLTRQFRDMSFGSLPDTHQEIQQIAAALDKKDGANLDVYENDLAIEEVLLGLKSPRILHLATHGFFLASESSEKDIFSYYSEETGKLDGDYLIQENPMRRSGIVLAGANVSMAKGEDYGVVTAEKLCTLDLSGTEMVVLSACNTGAGDVQAGDGVFGLQRAFLTAGAKSLVMSSWSVPSQETTQIMSDFYRLIEKGLSKAEALQQAKLKVLETHPNPFYWGAFIFVGPPES